MIRQVEFTRRAEKQVRRLPGRVLRKLKTWTYLVEEIGLEEVRKTPGYHDEPLVGRRRGMRSIRLSRAYRVMYRLVRHENVEVVSIEEVSKHGY
ncbi:MAG: type II toxin-antitoxin system mRNA interferase toxin, RelE/StbE family [Myxococcales bacterium]|nr:type II toxin-antitoxin system mRNA interferase toxin, RelE/StbE family [Deltaproteobacteria bacterium]NND30748.1 type II toxin-antitoxin system mRNA interferase toxin, RelE/StbE family [Myxococcales bacterium]NNL26648.1 type II toxin-antitoxin system mRNA interferase toxin, RelE/StbE family [Myxococcales bacterium]